jgi:hypothetical protein
LINELEAERLGETFQHDRQRYLARDQTNGRATIDVAHADILRRYSNRKQKGGGEKAHCEKTPIPRDLNREGVVAPRPATGPRGISLEALIVHCEHHVRR